MVDQDYTAMLLIIDRSGSMTKIRNDINGGLNGMLADQDRLGGRATVDIVYFDDRYEYPVKFGSLADTVIDVRPRGLTALHDAIVRASGSLEPP